MDLKCDRQFLEVNLIKYSLIILERINQRSHFGVNLNCILVRVTGEVYKLYALACVVLFLVLGEILLL